MGIVYHRRASPEKRERLRRARLAESGRLHDGVLTDTNDHILYYSYEVRGVAYHAAQDVSSLREFLPGEPHRLIGPVTVRYSLNNPANSIVFAEEWSGVRHMPRLPESGDQPSGAPSTSADRPPSEA